MVVVYHKSLDSPKISKKIRGDHLLFGKNQNRSEDQRYLLFLASQKLILASRQGYLPDLNRLTQSVSRFSRDNYTHALLINSPPEAYEGIDTHAHRQRDSQREAAKQRFIILLPRI